MNDTVGYYTKPPHPDDDRPLARSTKRCPIYRSEPDTSGIPTMKFVPLCARNRFDSKPCTTLWSEHPIGLIFGGISCCTNGGGVYLDDDAELLVHFNSSFVESVNSVYATQNNNKKAMGTNEEERLFGYTIYNGLLITKPCNRVLLSVAESMVRIGQVSFKGLKTWETDVPQHQLLNWYNLKLLAIAIAERSPPDLPADVNCEAGPSNCTFFEKGTHHKVPFNNKRSVFVYRDDHDWPTAVFDTAQCKMVVQQVPGGKHDAVSVDPHPSPWFPNMTVSPTSDGRWGK